MTCNQRRYMGTDLELLDTSKDSRGQTITAHQLERITCIQARSPVGLSRRERDMFHFLLTALICNPKADRIKSSLGHISSCMGVAHVGMSKSTVRRALADLEKRGFVHRRTCRLGVDRLGIELVINMSRFSFWIQKPVKNIRPFPAQQIDAIQDDKKCKQSKCVDSVYISSHHSIRLGEDCTINSSVLNPDIELTTCYHARARNEPKKQSKKFKY